MSFPPVFIATSVDANKYTTAQTTSLYNINRPTQKLIDDKPNIQQLCRTVMVAKNCYNNLKESISNFETNDNFKVI
jgi:hypothetical protein